MADRNNELQAEGESAALKKLQAAAGFVDKPQAERLDWMYEQSAASIQKTDEEKMNLAVGSQADKDLEDVKKLQESHAGSLFLKSATKTNEDMLRKLREDPLFQIRRQEQAAKESMMANPLIAARMKQKQEKVSKKEMKKAKKAEKKEMKKMKKAAKKEKKAAKKAGKKSSSSDDSSESITGGAPGGGARGPPAEGRPMLGRGDPGGAAKRQRSPSPVQQKRNDEAARLGPSGIVTDIREQRAQQIAKQKEAALASRGAPKRMSEEEKQRRYEQMRADAKAHERHKDSRIATAEERDKAIDEMEKQMRSNSDQSYFREMRKDAYMGDADKSVADRLKNQRHRRQKNLNDPLERGA